MNTESSPEAVDSAAAQIAHALLHTVTRESHFLDTLNELVSRVLYDRIVTTFRPELQLDRMKLLLALQWRLYGSLPSQIRWQANPSGPTRFLKERGEPKFSLSPESLDLGLYTSIEIHVLGNSKAPEAVEEIRLKLGFKQFQSNHPEGAVVEIAFDEQHMSLELRDHHTQRVLKLKSWNEQSVDPQLGAITLEEEEAQKNPAMAGYVKGGQAMLSAYTDSSMQQALCMLLELGQNGTGTRERWEYGARAYLAHLASPMCAVQSVIEGERWDAKEATNYRLLTIALYPTSVYLDTYGHTQLKLALTFRQRHEDNKLFLLETTLHAAPNHRGPQGQDLGAWISMRHREVQLVFTRPGHRFGPVLMPRTTLALKPATDGKRLFEPR